MAAMYRMLVALFLVSFALAAPSPVGQGFSIKQISKKPGFVRRGPQLIARVHLKYGKSGQLPVSIISAIETKHNGSLVATPIEDDQLYLCEVDIGGQTVNLDLDTGSSDIWVYSTSQPKEQLQGHAFYDPAKSKTSSPKNGYSWEISYGDGSTAGGKVFTDKVVAGGVTATSQAFGVPTSLAKDFLQLKDADGLLGLGFEALNTIKPQAQPTFFDNIKGSLPNSIFAVDIKKGRPGTFDFGYIDPAKHTGSITYTPVDSSDGYWGLTVSGIGIGSEFQTKAVKAVADTGSSLVYLPADDVKNFYNKVPGGKLGESGYYVIPCNAKPPSLTIGIGDYHSVVPGGYLVYTPEEPGSKLCVGGIQPNDGLPFSILGDIWLKSQYAVFDAGSKPRLGVAPKNL